MSNPCIKTGAVVFLTEYRTVHAADIFAVGNVRILRLNAYGMMPNSEWPQTHTLTIGQALRFTDAGIWTIIVPEEQLLTLEGGEDEHQAI